MTIDRMTKFLLLLIAVGLWFNAVVSVIRPVMVKADTDSALSDIARDVHDLKNDLASCVHGVMQVGVRVNR